MASKPITLWVSEYSSVSRVGQNAALLAKDGVGAASQIFSENIGPAEELYVLSITLSGAFLLVAAAKFFFEFFRFGRRAQAS